VIRPDLEGEYNNRARVPEHVGISMRRASASIAARQILSGELDIPYGDGDRHRYDLFRSQARTAPAPLVLYIHGGYWVRGDRKEFSCFAPELVRAGNDVAITSYSLCPQAAIRDIIAELRACVAHLWAREQRRPLVVGHSAGAHLAASLLATDWSQWPGVPPDLVPAAYAISGIYDLAPLLSTSIAEQLNLTPAEARHVSPIHWPAPPVGRRLVAAVGGKESREFLRQTLDIVSAWSDAGVLAECVIVPGANHFTVTDELMRPGTAMLDRVSGLAAALL
jgi:arylformamidase